jgi:hypothetical protein
MSRNTKRIKALQNYLHDAYRNIDKAQLLLKDLGDPDLVITADLPSALETLEFLMDTLEEMAS